MYRIIIGTAGHEALGAHRGLTVAIEALAIVRIQSLSLNLAVELDKPNAFLSYMAGMTDSIALPLKTDVPDITHLTIIDFDDDGGWLQPFLRRYGGCLQRLSLMNRLGKSRDHLTDTFTSLDLESQSVSEHEEVLEKVNRDTTST